MMSARRLLLLVCITAVAATGLAAPAMGGHWFVNRHGAWAHVHTRVMWVFREFDESHDYRVRFDWARGEWNDTTDIDLPVTGGHAGSQIHAIDGHWGWNNIAGLALVGDGHQADDWTMVGNELEIFNDSDPWGHYGHAHLLFNLTYQHQTTDPGGWRQTVSCHEIGHVMGIHHGGGGCMESGVFAPHPSAHDREHVNWLYGGGRHGH